MSGSLVSLPADLDLEVFRLGGVVGVETKF
jgi:hypothetical protein